MEGIGLDMQAGIARNGRTLLAALTAAVMVFSLMAVFASTASADHEPPDDTYEAVGGDGSNEGDFWETYLANERGITDATCWKYTEVQSSSAFVMPAEPDGEDWVLLVVKQGTTNFLYYDPEVGHSYPSVGPNAPGYSHIIVCSVEEPETFDLEVEKVWAGEEVDLEGITVTFDFDPSDTGLEDGDVVTITEDVEGELPEGCTYTSDLDEVSPYTVDATDAVDGVISLTVTNTVDCEETTTSTSTTTTTVQDTTTTTIEDEVLGTTVTTQGPTTTTIEDEVLGTEVLPFTGADSGMLGLIAGSLGLLGTLVVMAARRIED
jgi:hypothetical protein